MKLQSTIFRSSGFFAIVLILFLSTSLIQAQSYSNNSSVSESPAAGPGVNWMVGGRFGLSIGSGGGQSSTGLQIGPMAEVLFNKNAALGSELNINTQSGTPVEWAVYFKYYFDTQNPSIKIYGDGGMGLWFITGGPYIGLRFGGGANFKVANNLYIPADLQLGPVFSSGGNAFYIAITTGIRYELP
jgi:hypothetical protein